MLSVPSSTLRRMAAAVNARRYIIACVCLLIIAAALRFYNLSDNSLWFDEARAAVNSRGALSEVVVNTRYENSSPILYPLALWAVQKVASTDFSARLMPATASALTVAALLFLMPRLGVPRRAAFIAALLAALSAAAIEHAQDVREYSVDALLAVLMIAGLLQYLRNGGKTLLCAALFAAPLLQYGLILFGGAVIAAAALAPAASSQTPDGGARRSFAAAMRRRIRQRVDLLLPMSAFGAACVISWELTTKYQWTEGGWGGGYYLAKYYYQSGFDIAAIAEFAIGRTWDLLIYHMPQAIAAAALLVFGALLLSLLIRRRVDALALLCLLALGIALCAALMSAYPLGDVRQCLYLGPIIFLTVGRAFHSLVDDAAALARRAWPAAALTAAACGAIAFAGSVDIQQRDVYHSDDDIKQIFSILEERAQEGDAVYVSRWEVPLVTFYKKEKPNNYYYGVKVCWESSGRGCAPEVFDEMFSAFGNLKRIWMIHTESVSVPREMTAYAPEIMVEEVASLGRTTLHLITGHEELAANIHKEWLDRNAPAENPVYLRSDSTYKLYIQDNALYYDKQPCAPNDTEDHFFLHIYPEDATDLPAERRQREYEILDFNFYDYGLLTADKCIIRRGLPEYPINQIHTGQFTYPNGPVAWEVEIPLINERLYTHEAEAAGALVASSTYNLYLQDKTLHYTKQPCAPADTEARFFLLIYAENANDLPALHRQNGYDNIGFDFHDYGSRIDDKCIIRYDLPEYPINQIHTGQYIHPDGPGIWDTRFPFISFNSKEWLDMYADIVSVDPRADSTYNVYLQDDALYYAKRPCAPADTEAHFFLNAYPEDVDDLPADRRQYDHGVLNFAFHEYGLIVANKCLVRYPLPDYPIKHIHTGQFIYPDGPIDWETEFPFNP